MVLNPTERKTVKEYQRSMFPALLEKVKDMNLPADAREIPDEKDPKFDVVMNYISIANEIALGPASSAMGVVGDVSETVKNAKKAKSGSGKKESVVKSFKTEASEGVDPVAVSGNAFDLLGNLTTLLNSGKEIVSAVRYWHKGGKFDTTDKIGLVGTAIEGLSAAGGGLKSFVSLLKQTEWVPLLGPIMGIVTSVFGFVSDGWTLHKAMKNRGRMKKQRETAKKNIMENDDKKKKESSSATSWFTKKKRWFGRKDKDVLDKKKINDAMHGLDGKRDRRLDEYTSQKINASKAPGGSMSPDEEKEIQLLDEYDITSELSDANEKRMRASIIALVTNDLLGLAASISSIFVGVGSAVGSSISLCTSVFEGAHSIFNNLRRVARHYGVLGGDQNKTETNKAKRRYNLAVHSFDNLKALSKKLDGAPQAILDSIALKDADGNKKDFINMIIWDYQVIQEPLVDIKREQERVEAMDVGYPRLMQAAENHKSEPGVLVALMSQGFGRESR